MKKSPFERVYSLIDRKKLFQKVVDSKIKIHLKNKSGEIILMTATRIDSKADIFGHLPANAFRSGEKVTALFYVGGERYFLNTRVFNKNTEWILANDPQFFKFNRRNAFRIRVPKSQEISFHVSAIRNIEVHKKCEVLEFSTGGAKIHWNSLKPLAVNAFLKGVLQWGKGKILPLEATIVHNRGEGIYGIRWANLSAVTTNRLKLLSVELQVATLDQKD